MKLKGLTSLVAAVVTSGLVGVVLLASQEPVAVQAVPLVQTSTEGVSREEQPNRSAERDALEDDTENIIAEEAPVAVPVATAAAAAGGVAGEGTAGEATGSLLSMPVSGARLTSPFGYRLHPVLGTYKLHKGQDWAASCGTPLGAAGAGTVTFVGWAGGYGLQVQIDHGQLGGYNVVTTYNHLSSTSVTVGQSVTALQGIGRVGTTGMSTGCHLHFEVIADGTHTNPMQWISGEPVTIDLSNESVTTPANTSGSSSTATSTARSSSTASSSSAPSTSSSASNSASSTPSTTPSASSAPSTSPTASASSAPSSSPSASSTPTASQSSAPAPSPSAPASSSGG